MGKSRRHLGIFGKVFIYTVLLLLLVVGGMFAFFSNQIKSAVVITQQRQAAAAFNPLVAGLGGKNVDEVIVYVEDIYEATKLFEFRLETTGGEVLFETPGFRMPEGADPLSAGNSPGPVMLRPIGGSAFSRTSGSEEHPLFLTVHGEGTRLYISATGIEDSVYRELLSKAVVVFTLVLLAGLFAAFFFARRIANPIRAITEDTHKMMLLETVDTPKAGKDEIGRLAEDVYAMYEKLKRSIKQLEAEYEREKEMEENQRYFFSAASHELKTPIASASAILEGMLGDVIPPEEHGAYLRGCLKLMNEQNSLVSEILEVMKLEDEKLKRESVPLPLHDFVSDLLLSASPIMESKEQGLTVDIDPSLTCTADANLLRKALSNVLLNAAVYSPIHARICIMAEDGDERIRLYVRNDGVQIPEEKLARLFEPFYRESEARTAGDGHSGLGLTIVKKALDLQGIAFKIENEENAVCFTMQLPKAPAR